MRTTLNLDDDLYALAASLARARELSIGAVISDLVRRGLETVNKPRLVSGFPVFRVPSGARTITPEDVRRAEDEA